MDSDGSAFVQRSSFIIVYFKQVGSIRTGFLNLIFFLPDCIIYFIITAKACVLFRMWTKQQFFYKQCIKTIKNISLKNDTDTQSINKKSWILTRLAKDSHLRCFARINKEWYNMYFSKINIDYLKKSSCCFKKKHLKFTKTNTD